ncbi:hypothetical protein [Archangium lipolyticum]|uniref:hypothetical protein n=1 Tax=Archangium lipolyticum TaxID=2970465 RepID=UPI00214A852B|nr:hypothetical protein [Archangium lipolyticum]
MKPGPRQLPVLAFVLCFGVLLLRCRGRLLFAHLWAEDGSLFFSDALAHGFRATFHQYAGYFHVLPRLLAATFVRFPLEAFASLVTVSSLACYAASASLLARTCMRALIPHDAVRVLGAVAFCFLPGLMEIAGNLANLHSAVFLAAVLLSLKDLSVPLRAWELGLLLVIGSTAGEMVVLTPVFALRAFLRWRRGDEPRAQHAEWLALAIILGWAVINSVMWRQQVIAGMFKPVERAEPLHFVLAAIYVFSTRFLVHPLAGDKAIMWLHETPGLFLAVSALLLALLIWRLRSERRASVLLLGAAALCLWGMLPLTWFVRPGSEAEPSFWLIHSVHAFGDRHSWSGTPVGLLLWLVALQSLGPVRWRPVLALALCVSVIVLSWHRRKLRAYGSEQDWALTVRKLREIPPGQTASVPINPKGWYINARGPVD